MCLIVHKPEGAKVPEALIKSALEWNQDGAGVMSVYGVTKSSYMSEDRLLSVLDKVGDKECAVHMRFATHGRVNRGNTHPFKLADGSWLMHNGIFSQYAPKNKYTFRSDTSLFVDKVCNKQIKRSGQVNDTVLDAVCGYDNRLAIMSPGGSIRRYGDWTEYQGLMVSNTYAFDYPHKKYYGTGAVTGANDKAAFDDYDDFLESDIGRLVLDTVYANADNLISRGSTIDGLDMEDSERYTEMFTEGTDTAVFLAGCSVRSLVAIYDTLVRDRYI